MKEFKGTKKKWRAVKYMTGYHAIHDEDDNVLTDMVYNDYDAIIMAAAPEIVKNALKLIQQINMSDYVEPLGHNIKNNRAFGALGIAINKALGS